MLYIRYIIVIQWVIPSPNRQNGTGWEYNISSSFKSPGTKQSPRIRSSPAETLVENHRLLGSTGLKYIVLEGSGCFRVKDSLLPEEFKGILVQHLSPEIAVVACTVAAVEDMVEIRSAVAWNDFPDEAHIRTDLPLEFLYINQTEVFIIRSDLVGSIEAAGLHPD